MAKVSKEVRNITQDSVKLLNAIRSEASVSYKNSVPVATVDNLPDVGNSIFSYTPNKNEYIEALYNRIGLVFVKNLLYTNPLKVFKKGTIQLGDTVEEIWIGLCESWDYSYDSGDDSNISPFTRVIPDVKAAFHTLNFQKTYQQTTSEPELNLAFTTAEGVYGSVDKIIGSMYATYEVDEWNTFKELWSETFKAGHMKTMVIDDPVDNATRTALIEKMRATSSKLTMPSNKYNYAEVVNTTARNKQVVIITADLEAAVDVNVLAAAFHMEKTDFLGQMVVVDDFGEGMENVRAMVVDEDWFMVYDKLFKMESIYNPKKMSWNYFLHAWLLFSTSPFANALAYVVENEVVEG